jgi:Reverse transcriptase (RNA-dependent DNA polymerase)
VLKWKRTQDGLIERYKLRLVVKGYMQVEGMHYGEVFAPVARTATVWALLIHRAAEDLEIEQIDVKRRS